MRPSALICGLAIVLCACGGNAPPEAVDAGPKGDARLADAARDAGVCQCPPAAFLEPEHLVRLTNALTLPAYSERSLGHNCGAEKLLLHGGCLVQFPRPEVHLIDTGLRPSVVPDAWFCQYLNTTLTETISTTLMCLTPAVTTPSTPAECECPPIEPIQDRIFRMEDSAELPAMGVGEVSVSCAPDGFLVAASCSLPDPGLEPEVPLVQAGFDPDDPGTWRCTWNNTGDLILPMAAKATCIRPPSPGTAPETQAPSERIAHVSESRILAPNTSIDYTAICAPNEYLVAGSCTIESDDPRSNQITMFRHGYDIQKEPNAWRCAWNNPTDIQITTTATAVCLKLPTTTE